MTSGGLLEANKLELLGRALQHIVSRLLDRGFSDAVVAIRGVAS